MKNIKRVKSYDDVMEWNKYVNEWSHNFEEFVFRYLLKNTLEKAYDNDIITKSQFEIWDNEIRKYVWDFVTEFNVPIEYADSYWTEEDRFEKYQKESSKWERRIKAKARKAWNILDEFASWYKQEKEESIDVSEPVIEKFELNGIKVIMKAVDDSFVSPKEAYDKLNAATKIFVSGAKAFVPQLLKLNVPIYIDLTNQKIDDGGEYKRGKIYIYPTVLTQSPKNISHVLAHELAHVVWDKHIGNKEIWENFIYGSYDKLNLYDVLHAYGSEKFLYDNEKIKRENPVLYLQIQSIYDNPSYKKTFLDLLSMDAVKEYLDKGGNPEVVVSNSPISGYAGKNPQEAFCEAVGLLVTYGKKALLPEVYNMILQML